MAVGAPSDPTFHRQPREWPDPPPSEELRMHAPPTRPEPPTGGLMYALFPIMGSFGLIAFAVVYGNPLFIYIGVGMAFLAVLFAIGMRYSQVRQVKKKRKSNRSKYRGYLTGVERQLSRDATAQLTHGDRLYPDHERLWGLVLARRYLWERRKGDADFLRVRIGRGEAPHARPIKLDVGDDPITERERDLEDEAATVKKRWRRINDAPIVMDLDEIQVMSVVGPPEAARALARSIVTQLAAFRAPADVRLVAAFEPDAVADWEWMKWLPHVRGQARPKPGSDGPPPRTVLLANSPDRLGQLLDDEMGPRLEQLQRIDEQGGLGTRTALDAPRLVIVIDGFSPKAAVARLASVRDAMERGARLETTLILLSESAESETSEADLRVVLSPGATATVEERGESEEERKRWEGVWPDAGDLGLCEAIARSLAPLRLEDRDGARGVADEIRMLDLMGHASAETIDPEHSWRPRPSRERLRVPLGVTAAGEPLSLDLKEAALGGLGPHGLIVGATGSGKSELLRTLVAGLAVEHSPEELSVVLIDYKGGSAFAELARLPHAAGLITNLQRDSALVDRMRDALLGEQERRQSMLRDAGDLDDIGAYALARERDPSLVPMPHLLVVVDEFGELLAARSEFIDLFLGIGRVGRSLGMHLLFSSQRLDEGKLRGLESHLRYRICLRTYSAVESKIVLGTPDAYLLPPFPGAAYMKVDTGIYERFKVAMVSGSRRQAAVPDTPSAGVEVFSSDDGALDSQAPEEASGGAEGPSDLETIVAVLSSAHAGREVHQVWVAPLEERIEPAETYAEQPWWARPDERSARLAAPVGVADLPAEQRTEPFVIDFEGTSGHLALVGAPQSGKSTFLRTVATSLIRHHRPDEVRLYLIDLGGGGLSQLEAAPHVGGTCTKADKDRVRQTVRHIQAVLGRREEAFRRLGVGSMREARELRARGEGADEDLSDIFLVIDGWGVLRSDFEGLDQELEQLAGGGLNFGVHLMVTANRWGEMRPNLRDNVGGRLELRLNDPIESELGRRVAETLPTDVPGRGLTSAGVHFQTALPDPGVVAEAAHRWEGQPAPPVPVLPARFGAADLPAPGHDTGQGVPIGIDEFGLDPVYLEPAGSDPHFIVLGDGESGKTNFLRLFAQGLMARQDPGRARLTIVDYRRGLLDLSDSPHVSAYAANAAMASDAIGELHAELSARLPGADVSREELMRGPAWTGPRRYLLVDDYDLVPSATQNPLLTLVDLLAQGRDVGLHVILARRTGGMATSSFESFMQRLLELRTPGLLLSGPPSEGYLLGGQRATPQPPGRGLLVRRDSEPGLVQTAVAADADAGGRAGSRRSA
ncbi:MAG: type VII secretion protein EccCa [Thermoleophilaceae bacterium]